MTLLLLIILMPLPLFKVKNNFGLKNSLEEEIPTEAPTEISEAKVIESATTGGSSQLRIECLGSITEDESKINGCWLTWGWLGENHHTEQDIIRMVQILADNDIRILAPRSIAFVSDGTPVQETWYYQTYEYYSNFVQVVKEVNSDIIILAWISDMAQDSYFTPPYERIKLEDAEVRANVIDVCKEIVSYGLDGIAVDFEAIEDTEMEAYVTFVNQLKRELPNKIICVTLGMWIDWIYEASSKMNVDYVIPMLYGADGTTYESDEFITVATKISESSNPKILIGISYIGLENAQKVDNGKIKGFFIFHYEKMQSLWPTWKTLWTEEK
mgnify:CR=1 FL=1